MREIRHTEKIIKNPRRYPVTFIAVISIVLTAYFCIQGVILAGRKPVQAYNVGTPSSDTASGSVRGIILRDETVYTASESGYLEFYGLDGDRLARNALCLVIDSEGTLETSLAEMYYGQELISDSGKAEIQNTILAAASLYDPDDFSTVYETRSKIKSSVMTNLLKDGGENILSIVSESQCTPVYTDQTGFLMLWEDGYENTSVESLTSADFSADHYTRTIVESGTKAEIGDFIYKLAGDNGFQLVFPLTEERAMELSSRKSLTIRMSDGSEIRGSYSTAAGADGTRLGVLTFNKYGCSVLDERFLDFTILDTNVTGYRIPESAIVSKTFYVVDKKYITQSGEDDSYGVIVQGTDGDKFTKCTIYLSNDDDADAPDCVIGDNTAYIAGENISAGTVLIADTSNGGDAGETMTLGVTATVEGVYQINNAYCIFKPISRVQNALDSSYVIIASGMRYGISSYDRIVLNASEVNENEIILE